SSLENNGTGRNVLPVVADIPARGYRLSDREPAVTLLGGLGLKDCVGSLGHRRPSHNTYGLPRFNLACKRLTRQCLPDHFQFERVVGAGSKGLLSLEGVSVHRSTFERRNGYAGNNILGQDSTRRLGQGDDFRAQRRETICEQRNHVGYVGPVPEATHADIEEQSGQARLSGGGSTIYSCVAAFLSPFAPGDASLSP